MSELKPCPWQMPDEGVHDVRVYDVDEGDSGTIGFTVSCNDCLIDGPQAMAKKRAVELWNRRASPWVRVEDGLPEVGELVLARFYYPEQGHYEYKALRQYCESGWINPSNACCYDISSVTHWMPIPPLGEKSE